MKVLSVECTNPPVLQGLLNNCQFAQFFEALKTNSTV